MILKIYCATLDQKYHLFYEERANLLISRFKRGKATATFPTEGMCGDVVKFTPETVDDYIQEGMGGFIPVCVPEYGIFYSDIEMRLAGVPASLIHTFCGQYPKLVKQEIEDDGLVGIAWAYDYSFDKDGKCVKAECLIDNSRAAWESKANIPRYDPQALSPKLREILGL